MKFVSIKLLLVILKLIMKTNWKCFILQEAKKLYFKKMWSFLNNEYKSKNIFPPRNKIFACFQYFDFEATKAVIVGQDPYYTKGYANGLAFAVNHDCSTPKSLINIFKEIKNEYGKINTDQTLVSWAKQGVLLLNRTLTVEENKPNSHKAIGWNIFTNNLIKFINENTENIVFVLWGNNAKQLKSLIDQNKHKIITCPHPSPLSANYGFFGSNCFKKVNLYLNDKKIIW